MPVCPKCGKEFSSFPFGSQPAAECRDCRRSAAVVAPAAGGTTEKASARAAFSPTVTLSLLSLNILVYLAMGLSGVSWNEPSLRDAVRWGADFGPLTLSGDWWRVLTSTFVHFGILHIGFNMWCLWSLGRTLEFFMGRKGFVLTYIASGCAASLASLAWDPWRVSAGASGAIFGVAGAWASYLLFKKTPIDKSLLKGQLRSLFIFIGYNLFYGAVSGAVDNSAHIGGLLSGAILGALIPALKLPGRKAAAEIVPTASIDAYTARVSGTDRALWLIAVGSVVVLFATGARIRMANLPAVHYGEAVRLVEAGKLGPGIEEMRQSVALSGQLTIPGALLGELLLEQDDPQAAAPVLEHILVTNPNAYDIQHNLALAYLGSGQAPAAVAEINRALPSELKFDKNEAWRAQCILALSAGSVGDTQRASENLRLVLQSKPDFQEARDALERLESHQTPLAAAVPFSKLVMKSEAWPLYP
jgi:rhomboid protease GluP